MFVGKALILLIYVLYLLLGGCLFESIECPEELVRRPSSSVNHVDQRDKKEHCELWSFYNSLFFAFTSITTIGYGRSAPQTQLGRGVLLAYSLIGIPINGILIGTIGAFFSLKVRVSLVSCRKISLLYKMFIISNVVTVQGVCGEP